MFYCSLHSLVPVSCTRQKLLKEKGEKRQTGKLRNSYESKLIWVMLVSTFNYRTVNVLTELNNTVNILKG